MNLQEWYNRRNIDMFDEMMPLTFCLELDLSKTG